MRLTNKQKEFIRQQTAIIEKEMPPPNYIETTHKVLGSTLLLPQNRPVLEKLKWLDMIPELEKHPKQLFDFPAVRQVHFKTILTDYFVRGLKIIEDGEFAFCGEQAVTEAVKMYLAQKPVPIKEIMEDHAKSAEDLANIARKEIPESIGGKVIKMGI